MGIDKADLLILFEQAWASPAAARWGDVFEEEAERIVQQFLPTNRDAVIGVLKEWLRGKDAPRALMAVNLAPRFGLKELLPDIRKLDDRIRDGRAFRPYYSHWTEAAIASLDEIRALKALARRVTTIRGSMNG